MDSEISLFEIGRTQTPVAATTNFTWPISICLCFGLWYVDMGFGLPFRLLGGSPGGPQNVID